MPSCIDIFDLDTGISSNSLVVDALITDEPGPHKVLLSRAENYFARNTAPESQISNAIVEISSSLGEIELLTETKPGTYETSSSFRGVVGEEYVLRIRLENGEMYESESELMPRKMEIDSLILSLEERSIVNENGVEVANNGIGIIVKSKINDSNDLFRLRYETIHEILTNPELRILDDLPAPRECSGYVVGDGDIVYVRPCTCCTCYVENNSTMTKLYNGRLFSSGESITNEIDFIKDEDGKFQIRFYVEVQQLSLTPRAFNFWSSLATQQETGTLFNQPPGKLISNIKSVQNPSEQVLGYFNVSAIDKKSRFLLPQEFPFEITPFPLFREDCRFYFNSDTAKPTFW